MPRPIAFVFLVAALLGDACGGTNTSLGQTDAPVNAVACSNHGEQRGACLCADDGRWLCAGQNSVTCNGLYGSGGGRLLVHADMGCEIEWSECSDQRVYGVRCDGLRCTCRVNRVDGVSFVTPRCAETDEAAEACGWSLHRSPQGGFSSGPMQGMPCAPVGQHDDTSGTGCVCTDTGWDCPTQLPCRVGATWNDTRAGGSGRRLVVSAGGTFFWAETATATQGQIASREAAGFLGTWSVEGTQLFVRSLHATSQPACEAAAGGYTPTFGADCSTLRLAGSADVCAARSSVLDGLEAAR